MEEARELVKRNTRRYAKRQLSWLKRDGRARWLHMDEMSIDDAVKTICEDWRACGS
jgi:tRNA dimethylallyltransferase